MKKYIVVFFLMFSCLSFCQNNKGLQVSLVTCSPGQDLYSIFGHTAIRIIDSNNNTDLFYNYGTFDFGEGAGFYLDFTRGKLSYYLNTDQANDFFRSYVAEGRTITEQILSLSVEQKQNIQQFLLHNISGNNKYYKYDFLFDNCTTRARDVLVKNAGIKNNFQLVASGTTFRNMLHQYLDSSGMCWSKLGIDLLLGSKIDRAVTQQESSFLPDYLMFAVDSSHKENAIISKTNVFNKSSSVNVGKMDNYFPLLIFSALAILVLFLFLSKTNWGKSLLYNYSKLTLFLTGLLGFILLFMWFGTDHKSCGNNYNLLWALPTNLIALFIVNKKSKLVKTYFQILCLLTLIIVVCFKFLPQELNIAFLPYAISNLLCYKFLLDRISK